ncbi:MAG: hypothetical protein WAU39_06725 [Polyangiales bacterium]
MPTRTVEDPLLVERSFEEVLGAPNEAVDALKRRISSNEPTRFGGTNGASLRAGLAAS